MGRVAFLSLTTSGGSLCTLCTQTGRHQGGPTRHFSKLWILKVTMKACTKETFYAELGFVLHLSFFDWISHLDLIFFSRLYFCFPWIDSSCQNAVRMQFPAHIFYAQISDGGGT